ncbi:HTH-like domain protein [Paraburkholderia xenovorans LB400]|uniref:hypothetical protein n=1 Tax=Paraburkholderia xenovorans TaxID=36873 RepID=UPI00003C49FD|nr:hypothetical protein [Paraburkholderia xenovorans]AIP34452.1 HTH-like domain protein [Paraburkholderia xenovorans LB400]
MPQPLGRCKDVFDPVTYLRLGKVMPMVPSAYCRHVVRRADPARLPAQARRDAMLRGKTRCVQEGRFEVHGGRKVWRQLACEGFQVARCMVERLMKTLDLPGMRRGSFIRTTVSGSPR